MSGADGVGVFAAPHATCHQHFTVLSDGLANRLQALFLGGIDEAASVNDDDACVLIVRRDVVPLNAELREYPL